MSINTIKKINNIDFDETFEIVFGEEQTLNPGTVKVLFHQKQALLKNRITGEITSTEIYSNSEELGALLVKEKFCIS